MFDEEIIFEAMAFRGVEPSINCRIDKDNIEVETPESVTADDYEVHIQHPTVHKSVIVVDEYNGNHISTIHSGEIDRDRIDEILSEPREIFVLEQSGRSNAVDVTRIK